MNSKLLLIITVLCSIIAPVVGCTPKTETTATATQPVTGASTPPANYQATVKQIQDDPNIPPALKAVQMQGAKERFGPAASGQKPAAPPPGPK